MARSARLVVPGQPHHLIQRGNDRRLVFQDDADYQMFLDWLGKAARQFKVALHAYVLMPNHLHLLATPTDETGLARMMQWVGRYYVPYFNRKYECVGTLWQGRYKTTVIDSERYLMVCMRYIELNPVRAQMLTDAARYRWSSYVHHIGVHTDPLITDHALYWALGNTPFAREAAYRALFEQALSAQQISELAEVKLNGRALGSDQFKQQLERQTTRRVLMGRPGRPAKKLIQAEK
ncbi:MAG: transposase [Herbaspirillum sp.]